MEIYLDVVTFISICVEYKLQVFDMKKSITFGGRKA